MKTSALCLIVLISCYFFGSLRAQESPWPMSSQNPQRTSQSSTLTSPFCFPYISATADVSDATPLQNTIFTQPIVDSNQVSYYGLNDTIYALNDDNDGFKWSTTVGDGFLVSNVAIYEKLNLLFASYQNETGSSFAIALDSTSGEIIWKQLLTDTVDSDVLIDSTNNIAYYSLSSSAIAVNITSVQQKQSTNNILWTYVFDTNSANFMSPLLVSKNSPYIYAYFWKYLPETYIIVSLDKITGKPQQTLNVTSFCSNCMSTVAVTYTGDVILKNASHSFVIPAPEKASQNFTIIPGIVFATTQDYILAGQPSSVSAYDVHSYKRVWNTAIPPTHFANNTVNGISVGGTQGIYVSSYVEQSTQAFLTALNYKNGDIAWQIPFSTPSNDEEPIQVPVLAGPKTILVKVGHYLHQFSTCSSRGQCGTDSWTKCSCDLNYHGSNCSFFCEKGSVSQDSNTGQMSCVCATNYYGDGCDLYCNSDKTCSGHGDCSKSGSCECHKSFFHDYYGTKCEQKKVKGTVALPILAAIAILLAFITFGVRYRLKKMGGYQTLN